LKVSGTITDRAGILLALLAVLYCITPIHNGNIFWHLRNGLDILETGEIRTADPFSWTMRGACWIQHEWLAESALALSWIALGEPGPVLLKALLVGLSVLLAYKAAIRNGGNPGFAFLFGAMWLILAQPRWVARPHFFSIFYFSFYLYMLSLKIEKPWKFALLLLPVQLLWVNTHAGFVMGIFLSAIPAMERFFDGKLKEVPAWLIPPAVLLLASGVHPNGFRSLEYLPSFLSQSLYKETIREWWSPFDPRYAPERIISRTALLLISITMVTTALTVFLRRDIVKGRIAALLILLAATVFAARNSELLAPAMLAWIPGMIALRIPRNAVILPALILAVIPFTYGVPREVGPPRKPGASVDWTVYPVALADTLEKYPELMAGSVVFNTNEISGYLQYRFGERLPLFIDGRCLIFPENLYRNYLMLAVAPDSSHRQEQYDLISRYGFNLMMFNSWTSGSSVYLIAALPGWTPVYIDGLSAVYAENGLLSSCSLDSLGYHYFDPLDPAEFIAKPLYLLPSRALDELLVQRDQLKTTILDRIIQAIEFRKGAVFPPIDDCCDMADYTLECWRNCREGNLDLAEQNALLSGDVQLQAAVSIL
jgi:hypothetical protein